MVNILEETDELLNEHNLNLNDVVFVVDGNVVGNEDFFRKI